MHLFSNGLVFLNWNRTGGVKKPGTELQKHINIIAITSEEASSEQVASGGKFPFTAFALH